jgi:hypothetical protein
MYADIVQVIVLKILEGSKVKEQQDGHDFTVRHLAGAIPVLFAIVRQHFELFEFLRKFFSKIVCDTVNFSNFVAG